MEKISIGSKVYIGDTIEGIICTDPKKFKNFYAIYADIIKSTSQHICCVKKEEYRDKTIALVLRDKNKMMEIGFDTNERRAIYCHEIGHCFSEKQKNSSNKERLIEDEVDSDTFAIKECGIDPEVMMSAVKKTYKYYISEIRNTPNITIERVNRYIEEMDKRVSNIKKYIYLKKCK